MGLLNYKDFLNESFINEAEMQTTEWVKDKYRKAFLEFLNDNNKELIIDPKFSGKYSFNSFKVKDIENSSEVKSAIESGIKVSANAPLMKVNGIFIPLTHLKKTGVFTVLTATAS